MYIINIRPTAVGHQYRMSWDGLDLGRSRTPLLSGARKLSALGADDDSPVGIQWDETDAPSLTSTIGVARKLTVIENDKQGPYFGKYVEPTFLMEK